MDKINFEPNGWTKTVVGFLWAVIIAVLTILVTNVIANENKRQDSEKAILSQISQTKIEVAEMRAYFSAIQSDVTEIKILLKRGYNDQKQR